MTTGAFLYGPGPCEENLKKQRIMYEAFQRERQLNRQPAALATGVLFFDEVKVVSKLMWNSRNQQLIGLAMNPEEMASLLDVYRTYSDADQGKETTYIMQFLYDICCVYLSIVTHL